MEAESVLTLRAAVVMPDHVLLFFRATGKLAIGQIIGRLKTKTRQSLLAAGIAWQSNFYEHRLRLTDSAEDVLRYVYLNPYRENLVTTEETYPHAWMGSTDARWFRPMLNNDRPFPEWLKQP